jgi:predicted ArsR family transcriptional regulator
MIDAAEIARIAPRFCVPKTPFVPKPGTLAQRILALLATRSTVSSPEAAAALGCPITSASKVLAHLAQRGLIKRVRACVRCHKTQPARFALNRPGGGGR